MATTHRRERFLTGTPPGAAPPPTADPHSTHPTEGDENPVTELLDAVERTALLTAALRAAETQPARPHLPGSVRGRALR